MNKLTTNESIGLMSLFFAMCIPFIKLSKDIQNTNTNLIGDAIDFKLSKLK